MRKLYYVRHGQTDLNVAEVISGQSEAMLTEQGIEQAILAGKTVKQTLPPIDLIICSPFKRTRETARYIAEQIDYPVDNIQVNDLLMERGFGDMEGHHYGPFIEKYGYRAFDDVNGAETLEQLSDRSDNALATIKKIDSDIILIVGHGSFGRAFYRSVHNIPNSDEYLQKSAIGNAEIIELI